MPEPFTITESYPESHTHTLTIAVPFAEPVTVRVTHAHAATDHEHAAAITTGYAIYSDRPDPAS